MLHTPLPLSSLLFWSFGQNGDQVCHPRSSNFLYAGQCKESHILYCSENDKAREKEGNKVKSTKKIAYRFVFHGKINEIISKIKRKIRESYDKMGFSVSVSLSGGLVRFVSKQERS